MIPNRWRIAPQVSGVKRIAYTAAILFCGIAITAMAGNVWRDVSHNRTFRHILAISDLASLARRLKST